MTRTQMMEDFELAFAAQAEYGNFSFHKDTHPTVIYTDTQTYWAFQAWVSCYETYVGSTMT